MNIPLDNFLLAIIAGDESNHSSEWKEDIVQKFSDCIDYISDVKNLEIVNILQNCPKIQNERFNRFAAVTFISYGNDLLSEALTFIADKVFEKELFINNVDKKDKIDQ